MKYAYSWLKEHLLDPLPQPDELRRVVTSRAFEVEEMEMKDGEVVFDIKVLPDRAHDALSHRGMAREIASLFTLRTVPRSVPRYLFQGSAVGQKSIAVRVDDPKLCPRYIGVRVDGVSVSESPLPLKKKLESIGARSINTLVDITNVVLFDIGQPMHVFDANKVKGTIVVRLARAGETMTTLDGKEIKLDGSELVVADDEAVLALAGIKGGKKAEVDATTTSVIFESANFDPTITRKTSTKLGIKTDASKRYENGMTSTFAEEGMYFALSLSKAHIPQAVVGVVTDVYPKPERWTYLVGVTAEEVNALLGTTMKDKDIETILTRLNLSYQAFVPETALQLRIREVLGKKYKNPSSMREDAPESFSCSSLISYLFTHAGVWMPSISVDKYVYGRPITKEELCFGDLIFSNTKEGKVYTESVEFMPGTKVPEGVDHVGMYLGDGQVLHATRSVGKVIREDLDESKQFSNIVGYRRILEDVPVVRYVVEIPKERLDLRIPADLIEEIGRHYGYNVISPTLPPLSKKGTLHKRMVYANAIREFLITCGYSEVITYSFAKQGEGVVEVLNPVGKDRPYLRGDLTVGMKNALIQNDYYGPLLGLQDVQIFETGNVFQGVGESTFFAIGVLTGNKERLKGLDGEMRTLVGGIYGHLGLPVPQELLFVSVEKEKKRGLIWQTNLDTLTASLSDIRHNEPLPVPPEDHRYKTLSAYPFIVRDIALFVPTTVNEQYLDETLRKAGGDLVIRFSHFDRFQKEGEDRVSYAFRFVFQAFDRTLTDEEVNNLMKNVYDACARENWQVR